MSDAVWVHTDGWAGRMKWPGQVLKRNPKRSRVRFERLGTTYVKLVPNHAITDRNPKGHP
ncbi:MAG TPA: hypothetical protein VLH80_07210 [Nitrospiraceae bacterium]|nr:hypothetical protein [Nitrospiraceae bacterium]